MVRRPAMLAFAALLGALSLAACSDHAVFTTASPGATSAAADGSSPPDAIAMAPDSTTAPGSGSGTSSTGAGSTTIAPTTSTIGATSSSTRPTGATQAAPARVCGQATAPPPTYRHVVVVVEENRSWPEVGGVGFGALPWLHGIASQCTAYTDWTETNRTQNSLTQYIGLTSGVDNPATVNDCSPSATCRSTDDNIFRQVRAAGGTARTFVDGATTGCSAAGNAAKHVPNLYYQGGDDPAACATEVRPLSELDPDHLPTFAFIVPDLCHDGHDCANAIVDRWLQDHLGPVLDGADYWAGTTAVFVLYDEDHPVPNLVIAPTAAAGPLSTPGAGHAAALRTIEELLGLPVLPPVANAPSLRASAHI